MNYNKRYLFLRHAHGDPHWYRWSEDPKCFQEYRNEIKNQESFLSTVLNDYPSNYTELLKISGSVLMETEHWKMKTQPLRAKA